jgi:hypothetical protein
MKKRHILFGALVIALATFAVVFFGTSERNRLAVIYTKGTIQGESQETLLGVKLGDLAYKSEEEMAERHLTLTDAIGTVAGPDYSCYPGQRQGVPILVFEDETWRRGVVCLSLENGHVARIDWFYDPIAP